MVEARYWSQTFKGQKARFPSDKGKRENVAWVSGQWASSYLPCGVITSAQSLAESVEHKPLLAGVESLSRVLAQWVREQRRHPAKLAEVLVSVVGSSKRGRQKLEAILSYSSLLRGEVPSLLWKQEKCRMLSPNNYLLLLPPLVTKCHSMNFGAGNGNAELGTVYYWQPKTTCEDFVGNCWTIAASGHSG